MTNDEYIKALAACSPGDWAAMATVQADHVTGMIGRFQLDARSLQDVIQELADLRQSLADDKADNAELVARIDQQNRAFMVTFVTQLVTQFQQFLARLSGDGSGEADSGREVGDGNGKLE